MNKKSATAVFPVIIFGLGYFAGFPNTGLFLGVMFGLGFGYQIEPGARALPILAGIGAIATILLAVYLSRPDANPSGLSNNLGRPGTYRIRSSDYSSECMEEAIARQYAVRYGGEMEACR